MGGYLTSYFLRVFLLITFQKMLIMWNGLKVKKMCIPNYYQPIPSVGLRQTLRKLIRLVTL